MIGFSSPEATILAERYTCINCKHFHGWYSYSQGAVCESCLKCGCKDMKTAPHPKRVIIDGVVYAPLMEKL